MRILHVVPGLDEPANGIAVAAKLIAVEQGGELIDCSDCSSVRLGEYDEVWVHSMWLPRTMWACWKVLREKGKAKGESEKVGCVGPRLVRMTHANLDPLRLGYHGWKKRLVGPIERWLLRRAEKVVATCEAEKRWIEEYLENCSIVRIVRMFGLKGTVGPKIEVTDLKRFFDLTGTHQSMQNGASLFRDCGPRGARTLPADGARGVHVLYLGRRHPLKGVEFLERAVAGINDEVGMMNDERRRVKLRIVSDHFGEELEKDWEWCDVLCLPTLSENFGLVVAEALERGKRVVTTDGAPAWGEGEEKEKGKVKSEKGKRGDGGRLTYLCGYRDGTDEERVGLLKEALLELVISEGVGVES